MEERKTFTLEEIRILESSPYTLYATETKLIHTREFKELFWKMYNAGDSPRKIFKALGYDIDIIGKTRVSMYPTRLKVELKRNGSFAKDKPKNKLKPPISTDYEKMREKKAMKEMQTELEYLRQEVDFLKKLLELGNSKKQV